MLENGSFRRRSSENGATRVNKAMITQFCFATEIRESARHLSGNKDCSLVRGKSEPVLTRCDNSSLVVDRLCDQTKGQNITVACFYLDFAARKEQSATKTLGSLLKQIVSGMEKIPEDISRAFQEQKQAIGGRAPQLVDILKMLQALTSSQPTFICIDALDECVGVQRVRLLDSLKEILGNSSSTRIFMTGRPHIRTEIKKRLSGRVTSVSISPTRGDIIAYLRVRLGEDETPDAMDESLEADILEKIPENISEMCVRNDNVNSAPQYPLIDTLGSYSSP